jgi:hypothetical protein
VLLVPTAVRARVRAAVRACAPRPAAAERAAEDLHRRLWSAVGAEIRWAFTPPRTWLLGVAANVVLAAIWLLIQPITPHGHRHDWVSLIGIYFSSFILADVTTTNLLGADHIRVQKGLSDGAPAWRVLLIKNLALIAIVGVPTLVIAMVLTLLLENPAHLGVTIPNVTVPILSWIGVGNLVSVLHPVTAAPLARRWRQRHDRRRTAGWLAALTLPYAMCYVADPVQGVPHHLLWNALPRTIGPVLGRDTKSVVHLGIALGVWIVGTLAADQWVRRRGFRVS